MAHIIILYENISGSSAGGHTKELHQYNYDLETPAYKLREAYANYLDFVFREHVTSENEGKQNKKTLEEIIDDKHVYLKEILLRLFTAAISIDKNNVGTAQQAKKIIDCLEKFIKKINQTDVMYDKTLFSFSEDVSEINIAFAREHKEWICLLKQMQEVIENMHKHTASISKLMEVLSTAKITIARQLIAYISKKDISQDALSSAWVKYTLFEQERACFKEKKYLSQSAFYSCAAENYNSLEVNTHQQEVIKANDKNGKVKKLYGLLTKTNILLAVLEKIDILFSTTGWVLIVAGMLNLDGLTKLIKDYSQVAVEALEFDDIYLKDKNKKEIRKSLVGNEALSGIDFQQNLNISISGIDQIKSSIIQSCIIDIISGAMGDLHSLQQKLNCQILNPNTTTIFVTKSSVSTTTGNTHFTPIIFFQKAGQPTSLDYSLEEENKEITLKRFNELVNIYKTQGQWNTRTSSDTKSLFKNVHEAENDRERAKLVARYLSTRTEGRFYQILIYADQKNSLFTYQEKKLASSTRDSEAFRDESDDEKQAALEAIEKFKALVSESSETTPEQEKPFTNSHT